MEKERKRENTTIENKGTKGRECSFKIQKKRKDKIRQSKACVIQRLRYKERKGTKISSLPITDPIILCYTEQRWRGKQQSEENNKEGGEVCFACSLQLQGLIIYSFHFTFNSPKS